MTGFDAERGVGTVRAAGGSEYPFHAVEIVDGTRAIDVGREVVFMVRPGPGGALEAAGIACVPAPQAAPVQQAMWAEHPAPGHP